MVIDRFKSVMLFAFMLSFAFCSAGFCEEDKSYSLVEVEKSGDRTITKYEYDKETGKLTPKYYEVKLKKTDYTVNSPEEGAYKLTEVKEEEKDGENIITQYEYDNNTGKLTPKYYEVKLKKTTYGSGDTTDKYTWEKDENGNKTFYKITEEKPETGGETVIEVKYNTHSGETTTERVKVRSGETRDNLTGDFVNMHYSSPTASYLYDSGAAISNEGIIKSVEGNFISNSSEMKNNSPNTSTLSHGGAIYNYSKNGTAEIGSITGDFVNNSANAIGMGSFATATGGAIYNTGNIGNITGDFIGNYAITNCGDAYGGAIYNAGTIGDIKGDFIGNYASATSDSPWMYSHGGAISNSGSMGNITGNFIGNYAITNDVKDSYDNSAHGGAIYNGNTP